MSITNLGLASPNHISISLSNLRVHYNNRNAWVDPGNRYIVDTLNRIKSDFYHSIVNQADLVDYISSSIIIHCYNSWSYLSNSVTAYLEGDFGSSIHNAYYSELRSIMSFLASQGIGVFDKSNVIVQASGVPVLATYSNYGFSRTHLFAKTALDQWLKDAANQDLLLNSLAVEDHTMKSWFDSTGFPPSSAIPGKLAANWFNDWSLDVDIISDDQNFRNFVSYRPQSFDFNFSRISDNIRLRLNFLFEIWKLCAPSNLFSNSLLRTSLEVLYDKAFDYSIKDLDIEKDLKRILQDLGMDANSLRSQYLIKFLRRDIEPIDSPILNYAKIKFSNPILESDTDPVGIISRATLLALLNTRIVDLLLRRTLTVKADLKFWYDNIGVKLGYWAVGAEPYLYSDLWQDIELDINIIKQWLNKLHLTHSPYTFKSEMHEHSTNIKSLGKTYLWTMTG